VELRSGFVAAGVCVLAVVCATGCSAKRMAVGAVADALGGAGGGSFSSDDDPELVRDAIPFGLKLYETLLESTPDHGGLLVATASGFASYAYLLQDDASRKEASDREGARALRQRASRLYLRGRDYALRGLEAAHPGFRTDQDADLGAALARTDRDDEDFLYWAAAAQAGALSANKGDAELIADLPRAGAFMQRVLELDEPYGAGAAHEFFVSYEASRPGGSVARAREHFARAQELAQGERASLFVSLAENVSVQEQNLAEFQSLLGQAQAVDLSRTPQNRLANVLAQRRAQWLLEHVADLFLDAEPTGGIP
jgi:predicted anti-sigma-YlaC factor YlaD